MKTKTAMVFLLGLATSLSAGARAELSGDVTLTSDYIWRGVSQTDEGPAIQGGVEYLHESGLYAAIWASNVDFNEVDEDGSPVEDPARIEIDLYAGMRGEIRERLGWDLSLRRYVFPHTTQQFDYTELSAGFSVGIFNALVQYTNDVFATGKDGFYYSGGLEYELPRGFTLSASIGYSTFDETVFGEDSPDGYIDWHVGITKEVAGLELDLSYYDTNDDGKTLNGELADGRLVVSVSKSF